MDDLEFAQIAFVNYLRNTAAMFYDDNYQPYSHVTKKLVYQNVATGLPSVDKSIAAKVIDWLLGQGIPEYADYIRSGTANILVARSAVGKQAIIRIPVSSDDPEAHRRIDHPAVLQPLKDEKEQPIVFPLGKDRNIELLPFVPVVGIVLDKKTWEVNPLVSMGLPVLTAMYHAAGLSDGDGIKNDLGILPDGTPVTVDPDILQFRSGALSTGSNADRQRIMLAMFPYMKPVAWTKNGNPAQDKFFGANYLSTPLAPRPEFSTDVPEDRPAP